MEDSAPYTIGQHKRAGELLEIGCYWCDRHGYFSHAQVPLPEHVTFPEAVWLLTCSNCGRRNRRNWPGFPLWMRGNCYNRPAGVDHPGRTWTEQEAYLRLPHNTWMVPAEWRRTE